MRKCVKFLFAWTWMIVVVATLASSIAFAAKKKVKRKPASTEMPSSQVKKLLREVSTEIANCEKDECEELKQLKEFQQVLKDLLKAKTKNQFLTEENRLLKGATLPPSGLGAINNRGGCFKRFILKDLMMNHGITENGGAIYAKKPVGEIGAVCWSNSRKKSEATVTFCNFPLAVKVQTRGGNEIVPGIREREFYFDKDGCHLVAVRVFEQNQMGKAETNMTYNLCKDKWGKRTADAKMSPREVKLMEDIIGFCFRYYLLPPREEDGGRTNPNFSAPNMPIGNTPATTF